MSDVSIFHLEMNSPEALIPKPKPEGIVIQEAKVKEYRFNRFLYQLVGESWQWTDKLSETDAQWQAYAEADNLRTWVAYCDGAIAGYYELQKQEGERVEIKYFGLAPKFIGKGFGAYLLSHAIESAWSWDSVSRVWVHTCTLDHENALKNYLARGFSHFKTEVQ